MCCGVIFLYENTERACLLVPLCASNSIQHAALYPQLHHKD